MYCDCFDVILIIVLDVDKTNGIKELMHLQLLPTMCEKRLIILGVAFNLKNPFKGTLCLSGCTPDPKKVIGIKEIVSFKAYNFMIFVKNSRGGRGVNMINTLSK